jgi:putative glycosyl hydrolase
VKLALPLALLAALALAACGGDDSSDGAATTPPPAATLTTPATPAASRPIIGIGEQGAAMFKDKRFAQLGIKHVRLVVPYDATRKRIERDIATVWLAEARRTGAEPFITFGHSRDTPGKLPSVAEYRAAFRSFHRMFPAVQVYAPWNEINHNSQPTFRAPARAAEYYNAMKAECPACTVLAGDVLDQAGMVRYLKQYQRHLKGKPAIWGLHNYADANRFRARGLSEMLATVKGEIWLTETGGLVQFGRNFPRDEQRAARATAYAIREARDHRRVGRIYLYNWTGTDPKARFDAGLIAPDGTARPAFDVLRKELKAG